jgi:hypothetical protein
VKRIAILVLGAAAFFAACGRDLSLPPPKNANGNGCSGDGDCAGGYYCYRAVTDAGPAPSGFCIAGCRDGESCGAGKTCHRLAAGSTYCDQCATDADCPSGEFCADPTGAGFNMCSNAACGPPIHGTRSGLKLSDNLASVWSWAKQKWPGVRLMSVYASGLHPDGTVDITKDYVSQWYFHLQVGDGVTKNPDYYLVSMSLQASGCSLLSKGTESFGAGIPDADIAAIRDSTALVTAFESQANCAQLSGGSSDYLVIQWDAGKGYPTFSIGNWKSQLAMGNAKTAAIDYLSCP